MANSSFSLLTAPLAQHLAEQNVEFIQFAFKWIHLLLLRVLPVEAVIRMWDAYMVSTAIDLVSCS